MADSIPYYGILRTLNGGSARAANQTLGKKRLNQQGKGGRWLSPTWKGGNGGTNPRVR
jgi:hypothetical protein